MKPSDFVMGQLVVASVDFIGHTNAFEKDNDIEYAFEKNDLFRVVKYSNVHQIELVPYAENGLPFNLADYGSPFSHVTIRSATIRAGDVELSEIIVPLGVHTLVNGENLQRILNSNVKLTQDNKSLNQEIKANQIKKNLRLELAKAFAIGAIDDIIALLSSVSGDDHKTKNEKVLKAINWLITLKSNVDKKDSNEEKNGMQEIP